MPKKTKRSKLPQAVIAKAKELFGRSHSITTRLTWVTPKLARDLKLPNGTYQVECLVDGKTIASANHHDEQRAWNALVVQVERAFEESLYKK